MSVSLLNMSGQFASSTCECHDPLQAMQKRMEKLEMERSQEREDFRRQQEQLKFQQRVIATMTTSPNNPFAICIQKWVRGHNAKRAACRRHSAIVALQCMVRRRRAEEQLLSAVRAATIIQSHVRTRAAMRNLHCSITAVIRLQCATRRRLAMKLRRNAISAAGCLQWAARGMLVRHSFLRFRQAALTIQRIVRGHSMRRPKSHAKQWRQLQNRSSRVEELERQVADMAVQLADVLHQREIEELNRDELDAECEELEAAGGREEARLVAGAVETDTAHVLQMNSRRFAELILDKGMHLKNNDKVCIGGRVFRYSGESSISQCPWRMRITKHALKTNVEPDRIPD